MKYPPHLIALIDFFKKLPGVGQKSAERFAFSVLDWSKEQLLAFGKTLEMTRDSITYCPICAAMSSKNSCIYCSDSKRSKSQICIVAYPKDIFAIEETHAYNGLYHVLKGLLSPITGMNSERLNLVSLKERVQTGEFTEMILAFDSTVEGDATTLYLKREFLNPKIKISKLAFGMPVGSSLEYVDGNTLGRAFAGRHGF